MKQLVSIYFIFIGRFGSFSAVVSRLWPKNDREVVKMKILKNFYSFHYFSAALLDFLAVLYSFWQPKIDGKVVKKVSPPFFASVLQCSDTVIDRFLIFEIFPCIFFHVFRPFLIVFARFHLFFFTTKRPPKMVKRWKC